MNLDTPSWKNQFWYPFLEFMSQGWCFTSQTNLDSPSWKTSFYSPFWNLWVKGNALPLKQILIPLPEKPISISLFGIHESRVILYLPNEFWYPFMKNQFLYSWWVKGDALPLKWISIALHEKMNFLLFAFFFEWKKNWHHSFSCGV